MSTQVDQHVLGKWVKDKHNSDPLDEVSRLMQLGLLKRQAMHLTKGIEIKTDGSSEHQDLKVGMFSVIQWFKLFETYPLDGSTHKNRRRDLRGGGTRCHLEAPAPDHLLFKAEWDEPHAGKATDDVRLVGPDQLRIDSTVEVHGKTVKYKQVYRRS